MLPIICEHSKSFKKENSTTLKSKSYKTRETTGFVAQTLVLRAQKKNEVAKTSVKL